MQIELVDFMEKNLDKVNGVAIILDIFAAAPDVVGSFVDTGDMYAMLSDTLHRICMDFHSRIMEEQRKNNVSDELSAIQPLKGV